VLDKLVASGGEVIGIGKIPDIFAHRGITREISAFGNDAVFDATLAAFHRAPDRSIVFSNFVDFDTLYGHRRDVEGYARSLEEFDARLPELLPRLGSGDLLILSADHGCDPTWPGSDHTREHIPILVYGDGVRARSLGKRATFADIGQSIAGHFGLERMDHGADFLN
jgi:phosphopentomutase